ncbi:MAG: hypothetical protein Q9179_005549, partial [Wetmoreana sp. 5 TL-2023]
NSSENVMLKFGTRTDGGIHDNGDFHDAKMDPRRDGMGMMVVEEEGGKEDGEDKGMRSAGGGWITV